MTKKKRPSPLGNFVGMPAALKLDLFGDQVLKAFGNVPMLCGSAVIKKHGWRDVDVRLIILDEEFKAMGLGDPTRCPSGAKWAALCLAFSVLGRDMTGLPIDFQIQPMTWANKTFNGPRMGIFVKE